MTHELIANMLGVRREGVSEAASDLRNLQIIVYTRGHIRVLDRSALKAQSCECYAVVKQEYLRLLPQPQDSNTSDAALAPAQGSATELIAVCDQPGSGLLPSCFCCQQPVPDCRKRPGRPSYWFVKSPPDLRSTVVISYGVLRPAADA